MAALKRLGVRLLDPFGGCEPHGIPDHGGKARGDGQDEQRTALSHLSFHAACIIFREEPRSPPSG
jgi:hypothetical protein